MKPNDISLHLILQYTFSATIYDSKNVKKFDYPYMFESFDPASIPTIN